MNVRNRLLKLINQILFFFFVVNSLAYRLLWPSETDRQIISGIHRFFDFRLLKILFEFLDLSLLPDKASLIERIKQQSMFYSFIFECY